MKAVRLTYDNAPSEVRIPDEFLERRLEIIIMDVGDVEENAPNSVPSPGLESYAGSWKGAPLVREPQGDFETRREIE